MDTYLRFLYEFLTQFFAGFITFFKGLWEGLKQIFNIQGYRDIIKNYQRDLSGPEWVLVAIAVGAVVIFVAILGLLIFFLIKRKIKSRNKGFNQQELLDEIAMLHNKVVDLIKEKEDILAMKVSQMGLSPTESSTITQKGETTSEGEAEDEDLVDGGVRFPKLNEIDVEYANYKIKNYNNTFTLAELCETFRQFAASRLKLYYSIEMMRLFISSIGAAKLVILQGISGTGKTSLAYAWGKFLKNDSCIASVQPSWRDRTELFGYFNEFTKKFNETDVLREIYLAGYTDDIYTIILDEMNIARVEYYFAEMLSILEMPDKNEWIVELVPSSWKRDPKKIIGGKLQIAPNIWYIGTINNDDSTFMVTDKVYDRAMPIDINDKGVPFEPVDTPPMDINYTYLDALFKKAVKENPVSIETRQNIEKMDDYVIQHFRIAFGNRIVRQLNEYVQYL